MEDEIPQRLPALQSYVTGLLEFIQIVIGEALAGSTQSLKRRLAALPTTVAGVSIEFRVMLKLSKTAQDFFLDIR